MEDLKVLVSLLTAQKVKQIEIITEDAEMSPKTRQLYEAIQSGEVSSDDEAAKLLYGENANHAAYRKLKYRLQQRLINTLFFIDIQAYSKSEYHKVTYRVYKNWAASKILYENGLRNQSMHLVESMLKTIMKFDMVDIAIQILKDLRMHYSLFDVNPYKSKKYHSLFLEYEQIFKYLNLSEYYYTELGRIIMASKNYILTPEIIAIEKELFILKQKTKSIDSFNLNFFLFNALYFIFIIKSDINNQLDIANTAITYFKKKTHFKNSAIFSFTQKRGVSLLALKEYDKALEEFNKCIDYIPTKSIRNTHYLKRYMFYTMILKRDYKKALELLDSVLNDKNFKQLNQNFREPWYLKEAFIQFLIRIDKIKNETVKKYKLRPFRLSRFLNEVSVFAKDKRGLNITINILQMLFMIVDEKYDEVLDKLSSLRQYNFRYLKRPEYVRSSTFIKMLLKIPEGDYKASTIRQKSQKYYEKLLEHPNDFSEHSLSLEIIPYEQLWEELLSIFPEN